MHVAGVRVELPTNTPVVLLCEIDGPRTLPIYVGTAEATSIAYALQGVVTPRPLTHDLIQLILETANVTLERVLVTELRDATYYAELHLLVAGELRTVSARPSDAMAIALRASAPIFAQDDLVDSEGIVLQQEEPDNGEQDEELVAQFREFLGEVRPEDFSGGS